MPPPARSASVTLWPGSCARCRFMPALGAATSPPTSPRAPGSIRRITRACATPRHCAPAPSRSPKPPPDICRRHDEIAARFPDQRALRSCRRSLPSASSPAYDGPTTTPSPPNSPPRTRCRAGASSPPRCAAVSDYLTLSRTAGEGGPGPQGRVGEGLYELPPLEIGETAIGHCLDAFLEVLGAAQPVLLDKLALGCRLDRVNKAAAHGLARRQHGERRRLRDLQRQRLGGASHLVLRRQHIGEPDANGFVAGNAPAGIKQQRRLLGADQARQRRGQAKTGMKAEPVEIGAKPRFAAGHPEIGNQGEAESAADRRAMHRADDRLFCAEEADRLLVEMPTGAAACRLRHRPGVHALREIGARAK